jgi:hypothetical protein
MKRREIAFLLIGLGAGLMLAVVAVIELMLSVCHHMFLIGFNWRPGSVLPAFPFVLVAVGLVLLYRDRSKA